MGMRYSKKGALRSGRCLRSCVNSTTLTMLFWLAEDIFLIIVELFIFFCCTLIQIYHFQPTKEYVLKPNTIHPSGFQQFNQPKAQILDGWDDENAESVA